MAASRPSTTPPWETFPHGADVGVRGFGGAMAEAFANAALALTSVITDPAVVRQARRIDIVCEATDPEILERTLQHDVPHVLDYVESQVPAEGFLFGGGLSVADISLATFFRNAAYARFRVDAARWPRAAAFVGRVLASLDWIGGGLRLWVQ